MAIGIGLLCTFGPSGRPQVLVLRDVRRACSLCGHEVAERQMEETSLHALTVARLAQMAAAPCLQAEVACPQCGEPASEADVQATVLRYFLPSGQGLIEGYRQPDKVVWQVRPGHPADVQLPPRWEPKRGDRRAIDLSELTPTPLSEALRRPLSAKEAFRIGARHAEPMCLADGLWVVPGVHSGEQAIDAAVALGALRANLVAEPLEQDGAWRGGYPGAPEGFAADLPTSTSGTWWAVVSVGEVLAAIERILRQLPVPMRLLPEASGAFRLGVVDAPEGDPQPQLEPSDVAREAARSLLVPADAARLELDRVLQVLLLTDGEDDEGASHGEDA